MRFFANAILFSVFLFSPLILAVASKADQNERDDNRTALRGHRRGSLTHIPNVKTGQARKIRVFEEGMDSMLKKLLTSKALDKKIDGSSNFSQRLLSEEVARKLETMLTKEENSDQIKSIVNPGIGYIHRALAAIKNSAEEDAGPILAEDFAKMLSHLLEDAMNTEGNGNEMLHSLVLEIKNTISKLLSSMNDHHVDPLLDDEMLDKSMASLFKDTIMDLSMALEDNNNGLDVLLTSNAAAASALSAAMASYLEQGSSTSSGNAENVEGIAEGSPLQFLIVTVLAIITFPFFILFLPIIILIYFLSECSGGEILPTGGTICDIFPFEDSNEDADGTLF